MPSTALLFPGQESHAVGMETPWRRHPLLREGLEILGFDPFRRLDEGAAMQQPAVLLCSLCALAELDVDSAEVVAVAGHDVGEYAALVAAGALAVVDAIRIVEARGAAMDAAHRPAGRGAFAIAAAADRLTEVLDAADVTPPRLPVISNGTATPMVDVRAELVVNLLSPIRWQETLLALESLGAARHVEVGPGAVRGPAAVTA